MQLEFIIILQILAVCSLMYGYLRKQPLFTVLAAVVFGILVIGYFNVEESVLTSNSTTISYSTPTIDLVEYTYREEVKQFSEPAMSFLNVGLFGLSILFFFTDVFYNQGGTYE